MGVENLISTVESAIAKYSQVTKNKTVKAMFLDTQEIFDGQERYAAIVAPGETTEFADGSTTTEYVIQLWARCNSKNVNERVAELEQLVYTLEDSLGTAGINKAAEHIPSGEIDGLARNIVIRTLTVEL